MAVGAAMAMPMAAGRQAAPYDLVIVGARIVDGTGAPARAADIALEGRPHRRIGNLSAAPARERLDARGLVVAPGFIDVHTHADDLAERPQAENFVRMGVTSIVAGNCGSSALAVGEAFSRIRETTVAVNFATLIGHNTVRTAVMGSAERDPSLDELRPHEGAGLHGHGRWCGRLLDRPAVRTGTYSKSNEIIELARVAANEGGLYATHMRNEGTALEAAVRESLNVARTLDMRLQISHLKVDSPSRWGASAAALKLIDEARASGLSVQADQYAYTAGSSSLSIRFPSWALEGGNARVRERLDDPATWAKDQERDCRVAGRSRLHGPFVGDGGELSAGSVDQRIVDERRGAEARRRCHARRSNRSRPAADAWWRRVNGLSLHGRRRHRADHAPPDGLVRLGCRSDRAWRRRAASSRLRQQRPRARRVRPRSPGDLARGGEYGR